MTGHLDELIVSLITLLGKWLGVDQSSRQLIPVRVRSRHAQMLRQSEQTHGYSPGEFNALPTWPGNDSFPVIPASIKSRGKNDPSCRSSRPDDL